MKKIAPAQAGRDFIEYRTEHSTRTRGLSLGMAILAAFIMTFGLSRGAAVAIAVTIHVQNA